MGPNYHELKTATPANWSEPLAGGTTNLPPEIVEWWTTFHDPLLNALIVSAVKSNLDLRVATARVQEARALRGYALGNLFPKIDATAGLTAAQRSQNAQVFQASQLRSDTYDAGFDATWEIDVFGGRRRELEAATAGVAAVVAEERDVLVTLLAEVARNYIELRGGQRRLAIVRNNIQAQQEAVSITQDRFKAGLTGELDVSQAKTLLAATESQVPTLETALHAAIHRLGVLLGQQPGTLMVELSIVTPIPATPPEVPVGLPSELLRRRPDVRKAERVLAAETARIGEAVAEYFPKFSLFGLGGLQSLSAGDWFTGGSKYWSAGPSMRWRIFDVRLITSGVGAQKARTEMALANYEKAVLTSLEDVENALVAYAQEQQRHHTLADAVASSRRSVELASDLYTKGLSDYLQVVIAQRAMFESEDAFVQSERSVSQNLVALYKALGGGWEIEKKSVEKK